jgi:hypothetical protein
MTDDGVIDAIATLIVRDTDPDEATRLTKAVLDLVWDHDPQLSLLALCAALDLFAEHYTSERMTPEVIRRVAARLLEQMRGCPA